MRLMVGDQSLNAAVGPSSEDVWQDSLADERPTPEEIVGGSRDTGQRARWLAASLAELSAREQTIIRERRLREHGRTLEELGARLGISKERVRQIEHRALQKLKASLLRRIGDPIEADLFTAIPM
jgi:RNA polymerase sigma-32 factor